MSTLSYVGVQMRRFDRSLSRFRTCAAQQDSACVSSELETERSIHPSDVHVRIADASLAVLLHDPDRARATVVELDEAQRVSAETAPADVRADLLLLKSDIAVAKRERAAARESLEAARLLLGDSELTSARSRRIDKLDAENAARLSSGLDALKADFTNLIDVATRGNRESTDLSAQKAAAWLDQVTDNVARRALQLSMDSARRASNALANGPSSPYPGVREPPTAPTRSNTDGKFGYSSFEDRMTLYRERLARFDKEQAAIDEAQRTRTALASDTSAAAVQQARQMLDSALLTLSALPEPLRGSPSLPAGTSLQLVPGYVQGRRLVSGAVVVGGGAE